MPGFLLGGVFHVPKAPRLRSALARRAWRIIVDLRGLGMASTPIRQVIIEASGYRLLRLGRGLALSVANSSQTTDKPAAG